MSKQLLHLTIELDGSVRKAQDHAPLSVLDQQWQERYEKGAELAIISAPAPEDDKQRKLVNKTINRCMFNGQRYALWPLSGETNLYVGEVDPGVLMLRIDRNGKVHDQKKEAAARGERLTSPYATRMLAGRLFPGIELALVQVPGRMTEIEEFSVRDTLAALVWKGRRYRLVGATGGAKDGKFYFAEEKWETCLARQYQRWPEAAISYFGILVSECEKGLIETHARVKVVNDHELGTNDSRGWVSQSLFDQMKIDGGALYQFRLAFELAQAKGTFKVMPDEVAQHPDINADIVIPESAIKPSRSDLIGMVFEGTRGMRITDAGDLVFQAGETEFTYRQPTAFQLRSGERVPVQVSYRFDSGARVGFRLGDYDESLPLVIDPVLSFSIIFPTDDTFFLNGIAVDKSGFVYLAGNDSGGNGNGWGPTVTKLDPVTQHPVYKTYFFSDSAYAVAADSSGDAYVTGSYGQQAFLMKLEVETSGTPAIEVKGAE